MDATLLHHADSLHCKNNSPHISLPSCCLSQSCHINRILLSDPLFTVSANYRPFYLCFCSWELLIHACLFAANETITLCSAWIINSYSKRVIHWLDLLQWHCCYSDWMTKKGQLSWQSDHYNETEKLHTPLWDCKSSLSNNTSNQDMGQRNWASVCKWWLNMWFRPVVS